MQERDAWRGIVCSVTMAVLCGAGCGDSSDPAITDDLEIREVAVIPAPASLETGRGHLLLGRQTRIVVELTRLEPIAELLAEVLRRSTGYPLLVVVGTPSPGDIVLATVDGLDAEGYSLEVGDRNATISASSDAGAYYGTQTLRQLLPAAIESGELQPDVVWKLPMVRITDAPRFEWRGVMLDVARHFFAAGEVQRVIDLAARYKLNRVHLHLTDDQGWRVQIDSWPDLTAIGSVMDASGGTGGYYSKEEYLEIVRYAERRFVTIVPEIDMPGHTNAALASYGVLNESGEPTVLQPFIPFASSSLWVEGEATVGFVEDVLSEIAAMTPGPYIHIGGDEALATPRDEYGSFMREVRAILGDLGKTMVGWEEIDAAEIEPPFIAQYWLLESRALSAHAQGASIIASPAGNAYLDQKYDASTPIGLSWAGFTGVEDAYSWDPIPGDVPEQDVLGIEAPLWTETVDSRDDIDLLMFPRLLGHAEIGWSSAGSDWPEYRKRLAVHGARMDVSGVSFYRSPEVDWVD